jgi:multidrug transporter EmrE-like cation transporter
MTPQWTGVSILLGAVAVESFAQVSLKIGAAGGPKTLAGPLSRWSRKGAFRSAAFWTALGVVLYVLQILLWTLVLYRLDVSVAFPMDSLCFVGVAFLSQAFLGEAVDRVRWFGVLCILAGTALMTL